MLARSLVRTTNELVMIDALGGLTMFVQEVNDVLLSHLLNSDPHLIPRLKELVFHQNATRVVV